MLSRVPRTRNGGRPFGLELRCPRSTARAGAVPAPTITQAPQFEVDGAVMPAAMGRIRSRPEPSPATAYHPRDCRESIRVAPLSRIWMVAGGGREGMGIGQLRRCGSIRLLPPRSRPVGRDDAAARIERDLRRFGVEISTRRGRPDSRRCAAAVASEGPTPRRSRRRSSESCRRARRTPSTRPSSLSAQTRSAGSALEPGSSTGANRDLERARSCTRSTAGCSTTRRRGRRSTGPRGDVRPGRDARRSRAARRWRALDLPGESAS